MNALVKKEIRLLLPSWAGAMVLALPSVCTRSDDGIPVFLLFFGMAIMGLTSIGRETSLNTFSQLLAQPTERLRIWKTKLTVLAVAFVAVFVVWRLAVAFSFKDYGGDVADPETSEHVLVAGCLVVAATFSGGLWAALLLRQIAGAFWLALLVPATLAGFPAAFVSASQPGSAVIGTLCVVIGLYFLGGFLFARWLFFRAQDVGWTGGLIALPEFKFFGASTKVVKEVRQRRPLIALVKKEFQLQQISLMGATALLVLHIGIITVRAEHTFLRNSAGEILTSIFWMLWLVMPVIVGAMSIAEERRLGVMEGQLCLPASRRMQFMIKGIITLFLGIFLGGVTPCLLEAVGMKHRLATGQTEPAALLVIIMGLAVWLSLISFFASSVAKNFLQAVGFAIAAFIVSSLTIPALAGGRMIFFESFPAHSLLALFIATPTLVVTLLWVAYLNYKNFRDGWYLLRRSLLIFGGAVFFAVLATTAIYNRGWELFKPVEPPHGAAQLSLANPPSLHVLPSRNLLVRLPDGRIWFDYITGGFDGIYYDRLTWNVAIWQFLHPLPESRGPQRFIAGSNWVTATTGHVNFAGKNNSQGYLDTVGIQPDGSLWVSDKSEQDKWTADTLHQFGHETNWVQLAQSGAGVILLKNDGTLWRWGAVSNAWESDWAHDWPGLQTFTPYQIGTDSDWAGLFMWNQRVHAEKKNGGFWVSDRNWRSMKDEFYRETNYDEIMIHTKPGVGEIQTAFVETNGTLWVLNRYWDEKNRRTTGMGVLQVGKENDWQAVTVAWSMMVALKKDGSLWQWHYPDGSVVEAAGKTPQRLGIHSDWVALSSTWSSILTLAADGSLWFWPDKEYRDPTMLLQFPKQPQFLGNVLSKTGQ